MNSSWLPFPLTPPVTRSSGKVCYIKRLRDILLTNSLSLCSFILTFQYPSVMPFDVDPHFSFIFARDLLVLGILAPSVLSNSLFKQRNLLLNSRHLRHFISAICVLASTCPDISTLFWYKISQSQSSLSSYACNCSPRF